MIEKFLNEAVIFPAFAAISNMPVARIPASLPT